MLKQLRLRLTLLAAALTGAVLVVMALAALSLSEGRLQESLRANFQTSANGIVVKLQTDRVVSAAWLAQLEAGENLVISLRDGGRPITFRGAWAPATGRQVLIDRAAEQGRALGVDPGLPPISILEPTSTPAFQVQGDHGDRYLASVTLIPAGRGWQSLVLLKDIADSRREIWLLRGAFAGLVALGVAALVALCWLFAGRAIRPIEESQRRQAEFIAAASHELRSPLAVIRTAASALAVDPAQAPRLRRSIENECARMARLVDDLLSLARSDAGTWSVADAPVDVDALLLETAEKFLPLARERGLSLHLEVPDTDLPMVRGDAQRLGQILTVLLDNALSYTPAGGAVTLGAQALPEAVLLRVADTGPGIPPADAAHIFDRFYRADTARNSKEHFGLGLSIAQELTRLHHGTLRVASTGPEGTVFELKLPVPKEPLS